LVPAPLVEVPVVVAAELARLIEAVEAVELLEPLELPVEPLLETLAEWLVDPCVELDPLAVDDELEELLPPIPASRQTPLSRSQAVPGPTRL
jgi:hypothetical protein